jgi:hypothetical protein
MLELNGKSKLSGPSRKGLASPQGATACPEDRRITPVERSAGGRIVDGEYIQTVRLVDELPAVGVFTIAQSYQFRGPIVHFRWTEFIPESDAGALLYEGAGAWTAGGNLLTIEYFNWTSGSKGTLEFEYSAFPTGLELISKTQRNSLSGRFSLRA